MEAGNSRFVRKIVGKKAAAMNVRKAERSDARTLFEFVLKLDREGASDRCPVMSVNDNLAAGFGADPLFETFIAESPSVGRSAARQTRRQGNRESRIKISPEGMRFSWRWRGGTISANEDQ